MDIFYKIVKNEINSLTCREHGRKAIVKTTNGKIRIDSCCDDFRLFCYKQMIEILEGMKKNINQTSCEVNLILIIDTTKPRLL